MKTTIEINGYEILIEDVDGVITVSASKEGDVVEEFTLEGEESQDDDDLKEFGQEEEEDFEDEESEDMEDEESEDMEDEESEDMEDEEEPTSKLESFQSFINKKK